MDKMHLGIILFLLQSFGAMHVLALSTGARCPTDLRPAGSPRNCKIDCLSNFDCPGKKICCKSGCQFTCLKPEFSSPTSCELERNKGSKTPGTFVPKCNPDGSYKKLQCWSVSGRFECWRVNEQGKRLSFSEDRSLNHRYRLHGTIQVHSNEEEEEVEEEEEEEEEVSEIKTDRQKKRTLTKCEKKRAKRLKSKRKGIFIPVCKKNGHFERIQCNERRNSCWCVNKNGKKIPSTTVKGKRRPRCKHVGCGRRNFYNLNRRSRRVVGGGESIAGSWPWQAALLFNKTTLWCGGSLIQKRWVVTAAQCFSNKTSLDPNAWLVQMGEHSITFEEGQEKNYFMQNIYIHPEYIPGNTSHPGNNDIALIRLRKPVKIKRHINKVCLPGGKPYLSPGNRCVVTGWGKTQWNGTISPDLREGYVDFVSRKMCNLAKSHAGKINSNFLCAGFKEGGTDACEYDEGGPLVCPAKGGRWLLAGIVSWAQKCGQPYKYGVYTNVRRYLSWIRHRLKTDS